VRNKTQHKKYDPFSRMIALDSEESHPLIYYKGLKWYIKWWNNHLKVFAKTIQLPKRLKHFKCFEHKPFSNRITTDAGAQASDVISPLQNKSPVHMLKPKKCIEIP